MSHPHTFYDVMQKVVPRLREDYPRDLVEWVRDQKDFLAFLQLAPDALCERISAEWPNANEEDLAAIREILARGQLAWLVHDGITEWGDCSRCGAHLDGASLQAPLDWDGGCWRCGAPPEEVGLAVEEAKYSAIVPFGWDKV